MLKRYRLPNNKSGLYVRNNNRKCFPIEEEGENIFYFMADSFVPSVKYYIAVTLMVTSSSSSSYLFQVTRKTVTGGLLNTELCETTTKFNIKRVKCKCAQDAARHEATRGFSATTNS